MFKNVISQHKRLFGMIIGLTLFALIPLFVHANYYLDLMIAAMVRVVLAMMFIMTLRTGLINMGIVAFWGVGAYASAVFSTKMHMNVWLSMPLATVFTCVLSLILGIVLIKSGSGGLSFVMLTSVIGMLFSVMVGSLSYLGGYDGISHIPAPNPIKLPFLPALDFDSRVQFFYLGLFIFVIIILITNAFYEAWTGRAWRAIGMAPRLAESMGINVFRYKLTAFTLSCTLCGLIGSFYAHYYSFISPDSFGMWQNIYVQIYAILGGLGQAIVGPIVGATIMTIFPELIRRTAEVSSIFTGLILLLLVIFLPDGLLSLIHYRTAFGKAKNNISKMVKTLGSSSSDKRGPQKL